MRSRIAAATLALFLAQPGRAYDIDAHGDYVSPAGYDLSASRPLP